MNINLFRSDERGSGEYGWLKIRYSFSFADYFDPKRERFGALRVCNEVELQGGAVIGPVSHQNLEIFLLPLSGTFGLAASDGRIRNVNANHPLLISAGSGIEYSISAASGTETCRFLELWIFPDRKNTEPAVLHVPEPDLRQSGNLQVLVSADGNDGSACIKQQARILRLKIRKGNTGTFQPIFPESNLFVFVISGKVETDGFTAAEGDALAVTECFVLRMNALNDCVLMLAEVPGC